MVAGVAGVETTTDPAEPGVCDDLVDVLITQAAQLGIPVHLLDKGVLNRPEPVAARVPLTAPPSTFPTSQRSLAIS
jgi:hypothetical protein